MNFIHHSCWNPRKINIRKNNVSFHSSFWNPIKTDRRTNYVSFHPLYRVSRRTDVQTLHFIRHNTIKVRQTDRLRFILPLNLDPSKTDGHLLFHLSYGDETKTDRQTSFHSSYWNPRKTDGQTVFRLTPRFDVLDRPTDKLRLISSLLFESTNDRRTNYVTFHLSYWNPRMTDGLTFHFTTHIGINVRQTDKLRFISLYLSSKWERQTNHFISPPILESQKDRQTKQHFILHIGIFVRQTDILHFISSFILESKHDRRTNYVSFHPLFWDPSKTNTRTGYVWFHPSFWRFRKTDGQITFHFNLLIGIQVRQTDKLSFISPNIGVQDRQSGKLYLIPHIRIE